MVDRKDEWIFDATCIHLAAQYCPKSLQVILSSVENKKEMIKQVHPISYKKKRNYTITPLHISAKKVDPISTKYLLLKFQMLFEQNVASIWQLETRKMDIFEQKTGISGEIF